MADISRSKDFFLGMAFSAFHDALFRWSFATAAGAIVGLVTNDLLVGTKIGLFAGTLIGAYCIYQESKDPRTDIDEETGEDLSAFKSGVETMSTMAVAGSAYWLAHPYIT